MNKNWHGLMKIVEIQHICNGEVVWEEKNILNTFHNGGELFVLSCCFDNGGSLPPAVVHCRCCCGVEVHGGGRI